GRGTFAQPALGESRTAPPPKVAPPPGSPPPRQASGASEEGRHVPDQQGPVPAARRQPLPTRREGQAVDAPLMPPHKPQRFARRRVPEPQDGVVVAGRDEHAAPREEGDGPRLAVPFRPPVQLPARPRRPSRARRRPG